MEDSSIKSFVNVNAADASEMVINKRRSSVFQRRSINPQRSAYNDTVIDEKELNTLSNSNDKVEKESFDLAKYISTIKNEKEAWKKVLSERKSQRRHLAREESKVREGVELDLSVLTEAERAFFSERPDYGNDSGNMDNLLIVATKVASLNMEVNHLHEAITEELRGRIEKITGELINSSDV